MKTIRKGCEQWKPWEKIFWDHAKWISDSVLIEIHGRVDNAEQNLSGEKNLTHNNYKRWNEEAKIHPSGKKAVTEAVIIIYSGRAELNQSQTYSMDSSNTLNI